VFEGHFESAKRKGKRGKRGEEERVGRDERRHPSPKNKFLITTLSWAELPPLPPCNRYHQKKNEYKLGLASHDLRKCVMFSFVGLLLQTIISSMHRRTFNALVVVLYPPCTEMWRHPPWGAWRLPEEQYRLTVLLSVDRQGPVLSIRVHWTHRLIQLSNISPKKSWELAGMGKGKRGPWKCCKVFCAFAVTVKRSVFHNFFGGSE